MPAGPDQPRVEVPALLRRTVSTWEGAAGRAWLDALPGAAAEFAERWGLTIERVLVPGGQVSLVLLVRTDEGEPATLKLGLVTAESEREPEALERWDGLGAVRLLRAEPERGAMLLERLSGDVSLRSLPEAKAMLEAAGTLRRLWVPVPEDHPFTTQHAHVTRLLRLLRERRDRPGVEEIRPLADEAIAAAESLLADPPEQVLLHGDFHHGNVLAGERLPWLAIDPKPLVGERAYDLAWLVRDRLDTLAGQPGPAAATRRRLTRLADSLEVDPDRLRGWSLFRAVEAGVWAVTVGDPALGRLLLEFASWL